MFDLLGDFYLFFWLIYEKMNRHVSISPENCYLSTYGQMDGRTDRQNFMFSISAIKKIIISLELISQYFQRWHWPASDSVSSRSWDLSCRWTLGVWTSMKWWSTDELWYDVIINFYSQIFTWSDEMLRCWWFLLSVNLIARVSHEWRVMLSLCPLASVWRLILEEVSTSIIWY